MADQQVTVKFRVQDDGTLAVIDTAGKKIEMLGTTATAAASKIGRDLGLALAGVATTAALAAKQLTQLVTSQAAQVEQLGRMSQQLGVGIREMSSFAVAAQVSGASMESFVRGVAFLGRAIAANSPLLKELGVTSRESGVALGQLADAFQKLPDGPEKTAIAFRVLGRGGLEMIPILNAGSKSLREMQQWAERLGLVMSRDLADRFMQFDDTVDLVQAGLAGLRRQIAAELLPVAQQIANETLRWVEANRQLIATGVAEWAQGAATAIGTIASAIQGISNAWSAIPEELRPVLLGAAVGSRYGIPGAVVGAVGGGIFAANREINAETARINAEWAARRAFQSGAESPMDWEGTTPVDWNAIGASRPSIASGLAALLAGGRKKIGKSGADEAEEQAKRLLELGKQNLDQLESLGEAESLRATTAAQAAEFELQAAQQRGASYDELIAKAQALDDASNRAYQTEIANLQKQRQAAIGGGEIALIDAQIAAKEQERLQRIGAAVKAVTEEWRRQHEVIIDLSDTFQSSFQRVIDGVLNSAGKFDLGEIMRNTAKTMVSELAAGFVKSLTVKQEKWDVPIAENFTVSLPGFLKTGVDAMTGLWSQGMDALSGTTAQAAGNVQATLAQVAQSPWWTGGGGAVGAAGAAGAGTVLAPGPAFWEAGAIGEGTVLAPAAGGTAVAAGAAGAFAGLGPIAAIGAAMPWLQMAQRGDLPKLAGSAIGGVGVGVTATMLGSAIAGPLGLVIGPIIGDKIAAAIGLIDVTTRGPINRAAMAEFLTNKTDLPMGRLSAPGQTPVWAMGEGRQTFRPVTQEQQLMWRRLSGFGDQPLLGGNGPAWQGEALERQGQPGVTGMRFGPALALASVFKESSKNIQQDANLITNNLLALGLTSQQATDYLLDLADAAGVTLPDAIRALDKDLRAGQLTQAGYFAGVKGAVELFQNDLPAGVDAWAIAQRNMVTVNDQSTLSWRAYNRELERQVEIFGALESAAKSATTSAIGSILSGAATPKQAATTMRADLLAGVRTAATETFFDTLKTSPQYDKLLSAQAALAQAKPGTDEFKTAVANYKTATSEWKDYIIPQLTAFGDAFTDAVDTLEMRVATVMDSVANGIATAVNQFVVTVAQLNLASSNLGEVVTGALLTSGDTIDDIIKLVNAQLTMVGNIKAAIGEAILTSTIDSMMGTLMKSGPFQVLQSMITRAMGPGASPIPASAWSEIVGNVVGYFNTEQGQEVLDAMIATVQGLTAFTAELETAAKATKAYAAEQAQTLTSRAEQVRIGTMRPRQQEAYVRGRISYFTEQMNELAEKPGPLAGDDLSKYQQFLTQRTGFVEQLIGIGGARGGARGRRIQLEGAEMLDELANLWTGLPDATKENTKAVDNLTTSIDKAVAYFEKTSSTAPTLGPVVKPPTAPGGEWMTYDKAATDGIIKVNEIVGMVNTALTGPEGLVRITDLIRATNVALGNIVLSNGGTTQAGVEVPRAQLTTTGAIVRPESGMGTAAFERLIARLEGWIAAAKSAGATNVEINATLNADSTTLTQADLVRLGDLISKVIQTNPRVRSDIKGTVANG